MSSIDKEAIKRHVVDAMRYRACESLYINGSNLSSYSETMLIEAQPDAYGNRYYGSGFKAPKVAEGWPPGLVEYIHRLVLVAAEAAAEEVFNQVSKNSKGTF